MLKNLKTINVLIYLIFIPSILLADNKDFNLWVKDFKLKAINSGISKDVTEDAMSNVRFLPKVIEYDRYQPEFYEDTFTYIKKRTNAKKIRNGLNLYKKEKKTIDKVENNFLVEKVSASKISKKYGTPIYCYSYSRLKKNILNLKNNFKSFGPLLCFSVKSNANISLLKEIKKLG